MVELEWYTTITIAVCNSEKPLMMDRERSETCRVSMRNKFEKLVHLVGFIVRKWHIVFLKFDFHLILDNFATSDV